MFQADKLGCPFATKLQHWDETKKAFSDESTTHSASPLSWGGKSPDSLNGRVDILPGSQREVDVLYARESGLGLDIRDQPHRWNALFWQPRRYRLTITVQPDDGGPVSMPLIVNWTGSVETIEVTSGAEIRADPPSAVPEALHVVVALACPPQSLRVSAAFSRRTRALPDARRNDPLPRLRPRRQLRVADADRAARSARDLAGHRLPLPVPQVTTAGRCLRFDGVRTLCRRWHHGGFTRWQRVSVLSRPSRRDARPEEPAPNLRA